MPPTSSATLIRFVPLKSRTTFKGPTSPGLFYQRERRRFISTSIPRDTEDPVADATDPVYSSYLPPTSLHASIVPGPTVIPDNTTEAAAAIPSPRSSILIIIALSILCASILCAVGFVMFTRLKPRKMVSGMKVAFQRVYRRAAKRQSVSIQEKTGCVDVNYGGYIKAHDSFNLQLQRKTSRETQTSNTRLLGRQNGNGSPTSPSFFSEARTIGSDCSSAQTMTRFQERVNVEEADITMALGIALRDCLYSESELGSSRQELRQPITEDKDARRASWEIKNRSRQGSDASHSTQQTSQSELFSAAATTRSSLTSIAEARDLEDDDDDEDLHSEEMVFEVARAQTQSMEIKKGILLWGGTQRTSLSESAETRLSSSRLTSVPSLVVTCPSTMTLPVIGPSFSSISVDLNDFPAPPSEMFL